MKIGFDIDNVITSTTKSVLDYINERLPDANLKMKDITGYYIENFVPDGYKWIVEQAFSDSALWKKVELIDGAKKYIEQLYLEGNDIYFATATTPYNFRKKIKFLERNFPFFPDGYVRNNTISIKNKQLLNFDILVDDCLSNLDGERSYISICYAYPWNDEPWRRDFDYGNKPFVRCENWNEIYAAIKDFERENKEKIRKKVKVNVKKNN